MILSYSIQERRNNLQQKRKLTSIYRHVPTSFKNRELLSKQSRSNAGGRLNQEPRTVAPPPSRARTIRDSGKGHQEGKEQKKLTICGVTNEASSSAPRGSRSSPPPPRLLTGLQIGDGDAGRCLVSEPVLHAAQLP